ncbi:MAG: beta-ketoacyl synthase N-terminal-like domain-containing protein, partial [Terracidiphilus sp.]
MLRIISDPQPAQIRTERQQQEQPRREEYMSEQANLYSGVYLAAPIIAALERRGLFKMLDSTEFRERKSLIAELKANPGYFTVALEALESLALIERKDDAYRLSDGAGNRSWNLGRDSKKPSLRTLAKKLDKAFNTDGKVDASSRIAQSAAIAELLFLFLRSGESVSETLAHLDPKLAHLAMKIFREQQWILADGVEWTAPGRELLQADILKLAASCRPVLDAIDNLLFGKGKAKASAEKECTSCVRDELHFKEFEQEIIDIFNCEPIEAQPRSIVFHEHESYALRAVISQTIHEQTMRGRCLDKYPLHVVGHEDDQVAPDSGESALHVLFLPDVEEQSGPSNAGLSILAKDGPAHYLDAQGGLLDVVTVLNCWQDLLRDLSQQMEGSRLIALVAHAAPRAVSQVEITNVGPYCLDIIRRIDRQRLITADAFLTLAANVGLFDDECFNRFPKIADPCLATLHRMVKRDYIVRYAKLDDLDRLCELEKLCWQHTQTPRKQIRARLQRYPQGQFVLEQDGRVLGVVYSQRIADTEGLKQVTAANVHELHEATGSIVQLLAVNIDPQSQSQNYGDQLLEFILQQCALLVGVRQVVGVTLCKSFRADAGQSFEAYIRQQGSDQDPVLAFHQAHGAAIDSVIAGYRPQDRVNQGYGVLVTYEIRNRTRPRSEARIAAAGPSFDRRQICDLVHGSAAALLGIDRSDLESNRPLMEMGLDSADLMKLQRHLEDKLSLKLRTAFFFEHNSLDRVIDELARLMGTSEEFKDGAYKEQMASPAEPGASIKGDEIAVIGMACRLPGGIRTPVQLWDVLESGSCVVGSYPESRGRWPADADRPGIDQGGFLEDVDAFDAAFFRISPAEAQTTDPQQRILLELAWACLEEAGILPEAMKGTNTGVYIGASNCDYSRLAQDMLVEVEMHHGVGSSLAVLANRLSYFFDFSGPSLVIDTACSSSLVALHTAIQSLRSGECSAALVGGVNIICHPDLSIAYQKAGMLAPDGRCKVFDARANGYVRSEGAVLLLLKPLTTALADRDRIHAVIRGSATNHGGLAGGLTVPNPQKQSELLQAAWKDAGIVPEELTYIEAHGTGTSLGDPIEIQGIQTAYALALSGRRPEVCGIGSIKSNLGHLEPASGVAGLLKVILSMHHGKLPASINLTELNPKISLDGSPLHIQDQLRAWNSHGLRLAGISSFGSGGANAHVVVQEYLQIPEDRCRQGEYLFVLSAADGDRLRESANGVIEWLENEAHDSEFADAIYSWQTGRTAMRYRLAIRARGRMDLITKLRAWLADNSDAAAADVWSDRVNPVHMSRDRDSRERQRLIARALIDRDLEQLALIWVEGAAIDWRKCYEGTEPRRISLPTYPFARERYWIDSAAVKYAAASVLHPLLHTNISDLDEQCYRSTFTGEEFFLADHRVRLGGDSAQRVLPGVALLEMARAAMEQASPGQRESMCLELRNTVWAQPAIVSTKKEICIALAAGEESLVDFEIFSEEGGKEQVHCQGSATWSRLGVPAKIDVEHIESEMTRGGPSTDQFYAACARTGLIYGRTFQTIATVRRGQSALLLDLRLQNGVEDNTAEFVLHPGLMDGAIQACVALIEEPQGEPEWPRLPFALDSIRILAPCVPQMIAWVRYSKDSGLGGKLDVDLCLGDGTVCVQMLGFSSRMSGKSSTSTPMLFTPVWEQRGIEISAGTEYNQHHILLCELPDADKGRLEAWVLAVDTGKNIEQRYRGYALACFEKLQNILQGRPVGRVLVQIAGPVESMVAGLSGLLKTASLENPLIIGQVILVEPNITSEVLVQRIEESKMRPHEAVVRYDR